MKNLLYVTLLSALAIAACKNTASNQNLTNISKPKITALSKTNELIKTFGPLINGVWVEQNYIAALNKTKSPLLAANSYNGIATVNINTAAIKGDSLVTMAGSLHEGISYTIEFKNGTRPSTILFGNKDLGYEINGKDTVLVIYENNQGNSPTMRFSRELKQQLPNVNDAGLKVAMNKALMAGTYNTTDNTGAKLSVSFTVNGQVTGLPGVNTYSINYDFNGEPVQSLDQIFFDYDTNHGVYNAFKINKDTLKLFETTSDESDVLKIKKLKYTLIRTGQ